MTNSGTTESAAPAAASRGAGEPVVRQGSGIKARLKQFVFDNIEIIFSITRAIPSVLVSKRAGKALVSRYDDVKEVFLADDDFPVSYAAKLKTVTGATPFMFGMEDGPDYRRDRSAMRSVVLDDDIDARLAPETEAAVEHILASSGECVDFVDLVRKVTFDVLLAYFGVPPPANGNIEVWATRLFEYICQFPDDPQLDEQAEIYGRALRTHVRQVVEERKRSEVYSDDVLGRCLRMQAAGKDGFSDEKIVTSLVGFIVAGLPQPSAVLPKALEQLLQRPNMLAEAQRAARNGDENTVRRYMFEAMRFDPLAPFLPRDTRRDHVIAAGTLRSKKIPVGTRVLFSFASAMMDDRRIPNPRSFNPNRPPSAYMLFGYGLHQCFAKQINEKLLPLMLMAILRRDHLVRSRGSEGRLRKQGAFAERLVVCFGPR